MRSKKRKTIDYVLHSIETTKMGFLTLLLGVLSVSCLNINAEEPINKPDTTTTTQVKSEEPKITCGGFPYKGEEPDFAPYVALFQRKIMRNWRPGSALRQINWQAGSTLDGRVTIAFEIDCSGNLVSTRVVNSSGDYSADQVALMAVKMAAPFNPLPREYAGPDKRRSSEPPFMPAKFTFDYKP